MNHAADELGEIRELTHGFAAAELRPHVEAWERAGALADELFAQLAELGFLGMLAPEALGGMAAAPSTWVTALAELAWGEPGAALAVAEHGQVVRALGTGGSAGARDRWLPGLVAGQAIGCCSLDAESAPCLAEADGGSWRLSGEVPWVGNARPGGLLLVRGSAAGETARFLVELDSPGVRREPGPATLGLRPLALVTITMQDVTVGGEARLDTGPDEGDWLALSVAAVGAGLARAALEHARDYAAQREQFGCQLRVFEGMQYKLADMSLRTAAAAALLAEAAQAPGAGRSPLAKVYAAEAAMYVATQAVQVYGGYGYMRDYPVEKLMRDARALSLAGGSDHLQRLRIAELLYRDWPG